jgi:hypothetical protein
VRRDRRGAGRSRAAALVIAAGSAVVGCGPSRTTGDPDGGAGSADASCERTCSDDLRSVVDCAGATVESCGVTQACDSRQATCTNACAAAETNGRSIGCEYYAVDMELLVPDYCFAAVVANTWPGPAKISVERAGQALPAASFVRRPRGAGPALTYEPYDPAVGIAPGDVAILFLRGGTTPTSRCPVSPAVLGTDEVGTRRGEAFRITTDVPVVAYQINPYGGGSVAITGASLLLPASAWSTSYVAVNAAPKSAGQPSMNLVAREDGTIATITPRAAIAGGNGIPPSPARVPLQIALRRGEYAQLTQDAELTGSEITANKPVGVFGGHSCTFMPDGIGRCDHAEQMLPPSRALGHTYVGVTYRPRVAAETSTLWRLVGAVNGTVLSWSADVGGPASIAAGQAVTFSATRPFVVKSQGRDYPFLLFSYMSSAEHVGAVEGDPDFVLMVPPDQFLRQYVVFADPTYPETNLVLVRARGRTGQFADVMLDCLGRVDGWQAVTPDYEYARVDLMRGNFAPVGSCSTGKRELRSDAPFGVWLWGWGNGVTAVDTRFVSYGYPGGMSIQQINDVIF